jgi:hypothetical protein
VLTPGVAPPLRFVTYTGDGFQEGVPLTYVDQVRLFQRYTYGACQSVFNPLARWYKGPLALSWLRFLFNHNVAWYHKAATSLYLSSYLAMAAAFYLVVAEALLSILNPSFFDHFMFRCGLLLLLMPQMMRLTAPAAAGAGAAGTGAAAAAAAAAAGAGAGAGAACASC